ncbi:outer membrane protein assembly factor BamB family protein [Phytomonospora endophytica]|uniref:Outer membrane protein assembly factor BamB n=1 Tax=Phytomonospora endophytica TaxID=714109 RepID=A0A841FF55_9ACTN|nr:PQQ-binding-like beta-propeller repeat protein [Phytomonospora endophytica]MBB6035941.1 outer membrane protein assembly factor BamB [Phytomonospora endophytica]GIG66847.1 hypothetical protein Pen01_31420 [Phytomonospora endophytica]
MPEFRIDLDAPEEPTTPPRRLSRRGILFGGAGVAVVAVGAGLVRLTGPDEPPGPVALPELWSHRLPTELGWVVSARVEGATVLVIAQNGLLALDRASGAERWRREFGPEILGAIEGGLDLDSVRFYVQLSGAALVLPRHTDGVLTAFEVVDLPTGATRFSVPVAPGEDGAPEAYAHVSANALLVERVGADGEVTAHALADGRDLWFRRTAQEAVAVLPSDVSLDRQPTGIANTGPGRIEPLGGVYLELRLSGELREVDVVRVDDGGVLATWSGEPYRLGWLEVVAGAVLLVDPEVRAIHGVDLTTGEPTWTREWLTGSFESKGPHWSFADGLLIDAPSGTGGYQLIDLTTGEGPEPFDLDGRKLVCAGRDFAVGIDSELAELTAFGGFSWTTSLRPAGWTAAGFRPEGILTGGGWLVIGGELGFGGETRRYLWTVELATGRVGSLPDGVLAGFGDGALLSSTRADERTIRLHTPGG